MAGRGRLHPDFGGEASPGSIQTYGMPYVIVDSTVPKKAVQFLYYRESDGVNHTTNVSFPFYPIPDAAITQPFSLKADIPGTSIAAAFRIAISSSSIAIRDICTSFTTCSMTAQSGWLIRAPSST